ncbi:MAG: penicillin-binding protein 1A [Rickettsiales bacterium]
MSRFSKTVFGLFSWGFSIGFTLLIIGSIVGVLMFEHFSKDLPDHSQLAQYEPPIITRLYAADGKLLAEYAKEKRVFVPLKVVPKRVIQAFLAAEDKNFYKHTGIDITGVARAVRDNIANYGKGKSLVGGSTITQQVVKNFLLSSEKSIERKAKEAILATRISQVYSKDKILELYLNEIYLGLGSYGVAAAAQNYFNKSLDQLTIEEAALLAAQPKAPSFYNPKKNYEEAKARRDWVIGEMREIGAISAAEAKEAIESPITLRKRDESETTQAGFFAEEVRREIKSMYGDDVLYKGGLVVKTTLDPQLQSYADEALRGALVAYDRRRGYRGPVAHVPSIGAKADDWKEQLAKLSKEHQSHLFGGQRLGMVTSVKASKAQVIFEDETRGVVPFALMKWTRRVIADGKLGPAVNKVSDIIRVGDVLLVGPVSEDDRKKLNKADRKNAWDLRQVPEVNGALVAMDPHTGRVLAMSGGYAFGGTEFNRATQAKRQPGSAFKPFVYLAGLENGFTPSTMILDAPIEMDQGAGKPVWRPQNYGATYMGPATMRTGLEKSRNTMTVRLAQFIGINKVLEVGKRFGIYDDPPRNFSIVLGTSETTLLRLANAYSMLVNGGKRVMPSMIERIDDRHGQTIYRRDSRVCNKCMVADPNSKEELTDEPPIPADDREQVADPRIAYQMVSMLQGVATRGTGARSREIGKIVAGKTGTTNDSYDTWFMGFSPDLVAGVYIGHDRPRTLGRKETGSSVALPAFISFMKNALADETNKPFRVPPGVQLLRVDAATGLPPTGEELEPVKIVEETFISGAPIYVPGVSEADRLKKQDSTIKIIRVHGDDTSNTERDNFAPAFPADDVPTEPKAAPPVVGTGGLY